MTDKLKKNEGFEITPEGSLGLLALGDIGLREWREVKKKFNQKEGSDEKK